MQSILYAPGEYVGKDMCQVSRKGTSFIRTDEKALFDKYQQAMASAADLIAEAGEYHRARRVAEKLSAVLPFLVVPDATLWQARYSSRGQLEGDPEPTDHVTFYLGRRYSVRNVDLEFTISHLHVMTETAVADLLDQIGNPRANGIWESLFGSPGG
jgi:hypothetical protein